IDIVASVFIAARGALLVATADNGPLQVWALAAIVAPIVWLAQLLRVRAGSWGGAAGSVADFVALSRRRRDDALRLGRFRARGLMAIGVLIVVLIPWYFVDRFALVREQPLEHAVNSGVLILAFGLLWVLRLRAWRGAIDAHREFVAIAWAKGTQSGT